MHDPHFAFSSAPVLERCCQVIRGVPMILLRLFSAYNKRTCSGEEATDLLISGPLVLPFASCFLFIYLWLYLSAHVCLVITCFLNLVTYVGTIKISGVS